MKEGRIPYFCAFLSTLNEIDFLLSLDKDLHHGYPGLKPLDLN